MKIGALLGLLLVVAIIATAVRWLRNRAANGHGPVRRDKTGDGGTYIVGDSGTANSHDSTDGGGGDGGGGDGGGGDGGGGGGD